MVNLNNISNLLYCLFLVSRNTDPVSFVKTYSSSLKILGGSNKSRGRRGGGKLSKTIMDFLSNLFRTSLYIEDFGNIKQEHKDILYSKFWFCFENSSVGSGNFQLVPLSIICTLRSFNVYDNFCWWINTRLCKASRIIYSLCYYNM